MNGILYNPYLNNLLYNIKYYNFAFPENMRQASPRKI